MTDKIEELIERLRQLEVRITMGANETCGQAADEIIRLRAEVAALRTQRNEVVEEAAKIADWHDDMPHLPGACGATIRNLKSQE